MAVSMSVFVEIIEALRKKHDERYLTDEGCKNLIETITELEIAWMELPRIELKEGTK